MIGLSVSDGGKASSLGTRDGDAMQQTRLGSPHAPTSMPGVMPAVMPGVMSAGMPVGMPAGSLQAFMPAPGQMYQAAAPMHMYPHVNSNPHPGYAAFLVLEVLQFVCVCVCGQ
jgi:hypothetical protein